MNRSAPNQPDSLARGISHAVVGTAAAATGYMLSNYFNVHKATLTYQLVAAGLMIWAHNELDLPVAKQLASLTAGAL